MSEALTIYKYLEDFQLEESGLLCPEKLTRIESLNIRASKYPIFINEFWTAKQRQASSLQEVSYRACFKPQLPRFFIKLFTKPGDLVYDPFSGRGTTVIEAALMERRIIANDLNPLSKILSEPRLNPPTISEICERLVKIPCHKETGFKAELPMFYHETTEAEIKSLRKYLYVQRTEGREDHVDRWIRLVATSRLSGHSKGFFSVYTMPPNQAVSPGQQIKINCKLGQIPEYRDTKDLILKKSRQLLRDVNDDIRNKLKKPFDSALFLEKSAAGTNEIPRESIDLTVTSPPFLNQVQYQADNWLRLWFNMIDPSTFKEHFINPTKLDDWSGMIGKVIEELKRITKPGGWIAFEVGEVKKGKIRLEEAVIPLATDVGLECFGVIINQQDFTKTSNLWGVGNNCSGTNSNRIVLMRNNTEK